MMGKLTDEDRECRDSVVDMSIICTSLGKVLGSGGTSGVRKRKRIVVVNDLEEEDMILLMFGEFNLFKSRKLSLG